MLIIGIDPGATGGIAMIPLYKFEAVKIYSLEDMQLSDVADLFREIRYQDSEFGKDTQVEVFLENPQLPQHNRHTGTNFSVQAHKGLGRSTGQMEGLCTAFNWIPNLISPQKWQNALDCKTGGDKNVTQKLAQAIFNTYLYRRNRQGVGTSLVTQAVADALLIALYGYLQYANLKYIPSVVKDNVPSKALPKRQDPNHESRNHVQRIEQPRPGSTSGSDCDSRTTGRPKRPSNPISRR